MYIGEWKLPRERVSDLYYRTGSKKFKAPSVFRRRWLKNFMAISVEQTP